MQSIEHQKHFFFPVVTIWFYSLLGHVRTCPSCPEAVHNMGINLFKQKVLLTRKGNFKIGLPV